MAKSTAGSRKGSAKSWAKKSQASKAKSAKLKDQVKKGDSPRSAKKSSAKARESHSKPVPVKESPMRAPEPAKPEVGNEAAEAPARNSPASMAHAASAIVGAESAEAAQESAARDELISELDGVRLPTARGKVGIFGGPKDRSAKPEDKLALPTGLHSQYERVHCLDARHFYCAMRWDYRQQHMSPEEGKRWWANKKLLVTNPANTASVVVRAVDYGPHENTGLAIAVSPGAAGALGVQVGDDVEIIFADQRAPLGPVK